MSIHWSGLSAIESFIEFIYKILKRLRIDVNPSGGIEFRIEPEEKIYKGSIDERIAKIDAAKANLLEGLKAIDELKAAAESNKKEAEIALKQIATLEENKAGLQKELEAIKSVVQSDVDAFRKIAGVPSQATIRRERIIGFISGVIASTISAGIVWGIVKLFQFFYPNP
ncbi:MAG: hypothetical protein QOH63_3688 [Acidobacteriota bacterium]|jgi:hypothetical protein|nr:hypothetical protein [Acidobacteriota bacterium]